VALVASVSAKIYTEDPVQQKFLWDGFKNEHKRSFQTLDDETHRFHVFLENLKLADLRNDIEMRKGGKASHGITKFSDMSQAEFEANYLTADPSMSTNSKNVWQVTQPVDNTATLVDWTGKFTTAVKDQGYCGSCWAFSATEQIESDAIRQLGTTRLLSAEQITQCASLAFGCGGGWTETAYAYVMKSNGLVDESVYPYTSYQGVTGQCKVDDSSAKIGVSKFYTIVGEDQMAAYVQQTGPLSVCLDASQFNSYSGGIMTVCTNNVNHCVQAVGVDVAGGYWKVRNSWGGDWGESGYIRLAYGKDTCHITNDPTWVTTIAK